MALFAVEYYKCRGMLNSVPSLGEAPMTRNLGCRLFLPMLAVASLLGCQQSAQTDSAEAVQNASLPTLTLVVSGMS